MNVRYHPEEWMLLAHASGAASEPLSLLVATHLVFCPACRATVAALETVGGALLADAAPMALKPDALRSTLALLDDAPPAAAESAIEGDVPQPLRFYIGQEYREVRWRRMTKDISFRSLLRRGRLHAYMVKLAPGASAGTHSHHGNELTLVLAGGFSDEDGRYGPGDIMLATPDVMHTAVADDDGDCVTLAMKDAALRFRGLATALAAKFFGF